MSNWEEALGQTQNLLEGLYIPSDLGTPWGELESVPGPLLLDLLPL